MARFTFPVESFLLLILTICVLRFSQVACQLHDESFPSDPRDADLGKRLTRVYRLKQGSVKGLIVEPKENSGLGPVEVFLGIPYAAPPVGSLRFMPPGGATQWPNLKMATSFAPVCPQMLPDMKKGSLSVGRLEYIKRLFPFLKNQSEDCLYLNVYVPHLEDNELRLVRPKYPVLIFIHGESFEWNSGNPYDGTVLAAYGKVIVITINYRLGILGFMKPSTGEYATANFGLLDQIAVLLWVKDNIATFNGDPNSVTLAGHGTGAACVNFLMVSPVAYELFHRVILMSGSALSDWSFTKNPIQFTIQVAQSLNCPMTAQELAECLRKKRLTDIMAIRVLAPKFVTPFGPIIDGNVIPNNPERIMGIYRDLFSRYELLYGCTELESYHLLGPIALAHGMLEEEMNSILREYTKAKFGYQPDLALAETLNKYMSYDLDVSRAPQNHRDTVLDILSDAQVAAPIVQTANFHSKANPSSYFYVFSHNSMSGEYAALRKSVYGEELAYVFGIPLGAKKNHFRDEYSPQEKLLSESVMSFWTNFAKTGNPNNPKKKSYLTPGPKEWTKYGVEWPRYDPINQSYMHLGIPLYVNSHYRNSYMEYWNNELPKMLENYTKVPPPDFENPPKKPLQKVAERPQIGGPVWDNPLLKKLHPYHKYDKEGDYKQKINSGENFGQFSKFSRPPTDKYSKSEDPYNAIRNIKQPNRPVPGLMDGPLVKFKPEKGIGLEEPETTTKENEFFMQKSALTVNLIVGAGILFLLFNVIAFAVLYYKKSRLKSREREIKRLNSCGNGDFPEIEDNLYDKEIKEESTKGCSVFKSKKNKNEDFYEPVKNNQYEGCKTPKSDDSGGFGQRFKLRRQMSSSTLDAHTKVRDWIAQEIVQRCSPSFLRKTNDIKEEQKTSNSNSNIINLLVKNEQINDVSIPKPNCKKGFLTGSLRTDTDSTLSAAAREKQTKTNHVRKASDSETKAHSTKTKPESAKSSKQSTAVSSKSGKSKRSNEKDLSNGSLRKTDKPQKVSVAVDATPATRSSSVLKQQPIEFSKSLDYCFYDDQINRCSTPLRRSQTVEDFIKRDSRESLKDNVYKSTVNLKLSTDEPSEVIKIVHKHSRSDPVKDLNYAEMLPINSNYKPSSFNTFSTIQPPVAFRNDINVTSRDERDMPSLTAAEALMTIKRRNYPKVLPDLPKPGEIMPTLAQKRLSLPPQNHLIFSPMSEDSSSCNSEVSSPTELKTFPKGPPLPPPRRSSTLGRNHQSPGMMRSDSLEKSRTLDRNPNRNYVEMASAMPGIINFSSTPSNAPAYYSQMASRPKNRINMMDLERSGSFSEQSENENEECPNIGNSHYEPIRPQPRLIISPNRGDQSKLTENKIIIRPTINRNPYPNKNTNIPRVLARDNSFEIDEKAHPTINQVNKNPEYGVHHDAVDGNYINQNKSDFKIDMPDSKGPPTIEELERCRIARERSKEIAKARSNSFTKQDNNKRIDGKVNDTNSLTKSKTNNLNKSGSISKIPKTPTMVTKTKAHPSPKSGRSKTPTKPTPGKIHSGIPQPVPCQRVTDATHDFDRSPSDSSNDTECSVETVKNFK